MCVMAFSRASNDVFSFYFIPFPNTILPQTLLRVIISRTRLHCETFCAVQCQGWIGYTHPLLTLVTLHLACSELCTTNSCTATAVTVQCSLAYLDTFVPDDPRSCRITDSEMYSTLIEKTIA